MSFNIKISGLKQVTDNLDKLSDDVIKDVQDSINDGAKRIADSARQKASLGPTGRLKRAIKHIPMPIKQPQFPLVAIAVVDRKIAPHAHLVEYGARGGQMPARPYLRPAFDENKASIQGKIQSAVSTALRRHN